MFVLGMILSLSLSPQIQSSTNETCLRPSKNPHIALAPCAWKASKETLLKRFPQWSDQIKRIKPPKLKLKPGPWFDKQENTWVYGEYDHTKPKQITVGRTFNIESDYDTMQHEMLHYAVDKLKVYSLTKLGLNLWVDFARKE